MKESISMTSIFQIVILFILLFTAIMALTINNSNAFGVKDEVVNIINFNNGEFLGDNPNELSDEIKNALAQANYRTTGECDEDFTGYDRSGVETSTSPVICIRKVNVTEGIDNYLKEKIDENKLVPGETMNGSYYQIKVFYQLDLPIIKQIYNFSTKGETKIIYS